MATIDKYQDVIDSRDIIERIEELQAEREDLSNAIDEASKAVDELPEDAIREDRDAAARALDEANSALATWDASDEADELRVLLALQDEAEGSADWRHGEALIRDSYFKDYAQELAEDTGAIDRNASWPNTCIDWDQAARELQMDYTSVEFDGVTYWIRS